MIRQIISFFGGQIYKYAALLGGLLFFVFQIRQSGKVAEQRKNAMEALKGVRTRDKIENDISNLSDDKLDKLYQNHIKRDWLLRYLQAL